MKIFTLERRQTLPVTIESAWDFFSNPANLPIITPPWLAFTLACAVPERMHAGMILVYRVRPFPGVYFNWVSEITHAQAPLYFVDEQRMGPYRMWHHQHFFTPLPDGVDVRDRVDYCLGYGPLDGCLHAWLIRHRLERIFDYRRDVLLDRFGNAQTSAPS
jgi:ligand-binding SRPBCC domain-containing protein